MDFRRRNAAQRGRRVLRVRKRVSGDTQRPRLAVCRSLGHMYAQIIDDSVGRTLVAASTVSKDLRGKLAQGGNVAAAQEVGKAIAEAAKSKGITQVVFDRRWYRYHGRVKALADAARAAGLKF